MVRNLQRPIWGSPSGAIACCIQFTTALGWPRRNDIDAGLTYLIIIAAVLFWGELSLGKLRPFVRILLAAALAIGILAIASILLTPNSYAFMPFNNVMAICFLLPLALVNSVPKLAKKYMLIPSRTLALGTLVLVAVALYNSLKNFFTLPYDSFAKPFAFGVFIASLGYVTADKIFTDERRLLSIENELAIAREIQASILPAEVPALDHLRVATAYRPMTAVAGDFYEFVPVDAHRAGFLVADVAGHGVPADLIVSMIKVAMQFVFSCADDPRAVLRGLNRALSGQLRGQFISAAYLWLDTRGRIAIYSAAGDPPLLRWRNGTLDRIESNGLLLGVLKDQDYPTREEPLSCGDHFLIYTDGIIDPENANGESFGAGRLEQVIRDDQFRPPEELSNKLLAEISQWQPPSTAQQEDITLIIMDFV